MASKEIYTAVTALFNAFELAVEAKAEGNNDSYFEVQSFMARHMTRMYEDGTGEADDKDYEYARIMEENVLIYCNKALTEGAREEALKRAKLNFELFIYRQPLSEIITSINDETFAQLTARRDFIAKTLQVTAIVVPLLGVASVVAVGAILNYHDVIIPATPLPSYITSAINADNQLVMTMDSGGNFGVGTEFRFPVGQDVQFDTNATLPVGLSWITEGENKVGVRVTGAGVSSVVFPCDDNAI